MFINEYGDKNDPLLRWFGQDEDRQDRFQKVNIKHRDIGCRPKEGPA